MRDSELFLALPDSASTLREFDPKAQEHIECAPGVVCVALDPPRDRTAGGLLIPESGANERRSESRIERELDMFCDGYAKANLSGFDVSDKRKILANVRERKRLEMASEEEQYHGSPQDRLRPDTGVVISVGKDVKLKVGVRVLLRPYQGLWIDELTTPSGYQIRDVRFYGVTWPVEHCILGFWNLDFETWVPIFDWTILKRVARTGLFIANPGSKPKPVRAEVIHAGPDVSFGDADEVLVTGDPNSGLYFKFAGSSEYEMVKEVQHGFRQIWAAIEGWAGVCPECGSVELEVATASRIKIGEGYGNGDLEPLRWRCNDCGLEGGWNREMTRREVAV